MRVWKLDNRHKLPVKPKDYNNVSLLLWGAIIIDWQWAITSSLWTNYYEVI